MANKSKAGKTLVIAALLLAFLQPYILSAAPHFNSIRSSGLLTDQSFMSSVVEEKPAARASFFGTLGPGASEKGAVKTFTIKVAKRQTEGNEPWPVRSIGKAEMNGQTGSISLARPVSGRLSSLFGSRTHPSTRKIRFHAGIDISAPRGTPVNSSMSGKVTYAGWRRGYGLVVVIDHGKGVETVYAHCSKLAVKVGQQVNTGQRIGYVGNTGVATGSHLHFEVRRDGNVRNPLRYMSY